MKKRLTTILMATIAGATLLSTTAFAENAVTTSNDVVAVSEEKEETGEAPAEKEDNYSYKLVTDTVTEVTAEEGKDYVTVMLGEMQTGIRCNIAKTTFVIDNATGEVKSVEDIEEGDTITVLLEKLAPMTMSIPPMTSGIGGVILNSDKDAFAEIGVFNNEFINEDNTLKLNLSEETPMYNIKGTKEKLAPESIIDKEVLVIYKATTRSIPAQTAPTAVVLLGDAKEEAKDDETKVVPETKDVETFLGLRDLSTELGFEIKWVANDKPVELTKGENTILVTLNDNTIVVNGEEKEMQTAPKLEDSKMYVTNEYSDVLSAIK